MVVVEAEAEEDGVMVAEATDEAEEEPVALEEDAAESCSPVLRFFALRFALLLCGSFDERGGVPSCPSET